MEEVNVGPSNVKMAKPKGLSKEMKLVILAAIIVVVVAVWIISQPAPSVNGGTNGVTNGGTNGGNGVPTNPLPAILAKADDITSITYTFDRKTFKVKGDKIWFKSTSAEHIAYNVYDPSKNENVYFSVNPNNRIVSDYPVAEITLYLETPLDLTNKIDPETEILEEATIDGKETVKVNVEGVDYWIWKDHGIVVQRQPAGEEVIMYTGFDFTEHPDSLFDVPGY